MPDPLDKGKDTEPYQNVTDPEHCPYRNKNTDEMTKISPCAFSSPQWAAGAADPSREALQF